MVIPLRLELKTYCLEGSCSILLSYGIIIFINSPWASQQKGMNKYKHYYKP